MEIGIRLGLALVAAGMGTLLYWFLMQLKVEGPVWPWFCRWMGLSLALFILLNGPLKIGN